MQEGKNLCYGSVILSGVISTHFPYRLHSIEGLSLTRISYVLDKLYVFVYNCNDSTFVLSDGLTEWNEVPEHACD